MKVSATPMCRVCLNTDKKNYISLFDKYKDSSIKDYVMLITNVVINEDDGFSDIICSTCFFELETALNFKQKCESSDRILKDKIPNYRCTDNDIMLTEDEPLEILVCLDSHVDYINDDKDNTDFDAVEELQKDDTEDITRQPSTATDLKFECHDCGGRYKSKFDLRRHWKQVHAFRGYICEICKRRFKSYKAFQFHKTNQPNTCKMAGNNLVRVEGEGNSRIFHCKVCPYNTIHVSGLQKHLSIHSGDKSFKCHICNKIYVHRSMLYLHMETVHDEYKLEITCSVCRIHIKGRSAMRRHLRIHSIPTLLNKSEPHVEGSSNTKLYMCESCAKPFNTIEELNKHQKMVHGNHGNTSNCELCGYTARTPKLMRKHRAKHTDTNFACHICGKFFDSLLKQKSHLFRHSNKDNFSCPYCDMKFLIRSSIARHIRTAHGNITVRSKEEENKPPPTTITTTSTSTIIKLEDLMDDMIEISPTTVG